MAVPLIGQSTTTSDEPEFASLSDEERERLAQMAEEHPDAAVSDATDVVTVFTLAMHQDGQVEIVLDVTRKFAPDRVATGDDIIAASSVAISQVNANSTAQATAFQMAQMGRMMQEQAQSQAIQAQMVANQAKGFKNR